MEKFRRILASISVTALLTSILGFGAIAQAATFSDVPASHWANSFVEQLYEDGVVEGLQDGTYGCDATAKRADFSKMVALAFGFDPEIAANAGFSDVQAGAWYEGYVNVLAENGVVGGYTDANGNATGKFGPADAVTRSAAAKMLVNAAGLDVNTDHGPSFPDVAEGAWYYDFVETLYFNSVVDGYSNGKFGPGDNLTRCQLAKMVVNSQNPVERDFDEEPVVDDEEPVVDDEEPVVEESTGALTVSVGTALAGTSIPKGATAVDMLNVKLAASGEAVTVSSLQFHRIGVGASTDFTNVYLYQGDNRLTTGRTISSDSNTVSFAGLSVDVPAGSNVELTLVADFSASAGASNTNAFEVQSADAVGHNGSGGTNGTFPVAGNPFTLSNASNGTLTIETWGSLSNVRVGEEAAEIAKFKLSAASEDIWLQRIALRVRGSVSTNLLSNFKLWEGGEEIATVASLNSQDLMVFALAESQEIARGSDKFYTVTADIGTADNNDVLVVDLDEDTDLVGVGEVYGFGARVDSDNTSGYDGNTTGAVTTSCSTVTWVDASCVTIEGGQVTVTFNGPNASDIATNGKDVTFFRFSMGAQNAVEVRKLTLQVRAVSPAATVVEAADDANGLWNDATGVANFTDIKIVDEDNGELVGSSRDVTSATVDGTFTTNYTDVFNIDAGEVRNFKVTMDIANTSALNGDTFDVTLNAISTTEGIRDTSTGDYVTDIVPNTASAGNTMTVRTPSLTVALASPTSDETVVKGSANVKAVYFAFTAGQASDVKVTSVKLTGYVDQNVDGTFASKEEGNVHITELATLAKLYDGDGVQIGTQTKSFSTSDGTATFSSLNWTIEAGQTEQLVVYTTVDKNVTPQDGTNDAYAVDIASVTSDITAQDESGNDISETGSNFPNGGSATAKTRVITAKGAGKITVATSLSPVLDDKAVSPNATTNTSANPLLLARYRIYATDEAFTVTRMTFLHGNGTGAITSVILKYPTSLTASTTLDGTATGTLSSNSVTFNSLLVAVPESEIDEASINVELYVTTAGIGNGANSGDKLDMDFDYDATFEAVGVGSGTTITHASTSDYYGTAANVTGNNIAIYKALPTFAKHTASTVCPATTIVASSSSNVYCFSVTASSGGAIDLYKMTFDATPSLLNTGTGAGQLANTIGWQLFKYSATGAVETTTIGSGTWSDSTDTVEITFDAGSDATVAAGGTNYYVLKAPVTLTADTDKSSLSVRIKDDSAHADLGVASAVSGKNVWSDRSLASHTQLTADWTNSYKLETLPSTYQQLTE